LAVLRPSTTNNYEIGLRSELFNRHLRVNITAFKTNTTDVQVTALVPGTNINIVQNAGDIRAKGFEANIEGLIGRNLTIQGGFSYLDAVFRNLNQPCYPNQANDPAAPRPCVGGTQSVDGTPALNAPKYKFTLAATYTVRDVFSGWNMYLRPDLRYQSRVFYQLDHDPFAAQRGYTVADFGLGLTSQDSKYEIRLFVNNITNRFFCTNMVNSVVGRQACQSPSEDAQRRFGAAFTVRF
jgi:iron complex outermembrane receptor protein